MAKRVLCTALLLPILTSGMDAQRSEIDEAKAAMARLEFLVGRWEGTSAMRMGPGPAVESVGSEVVQWRLDGLALLVEGEFHSPDAEADESPTHLALGVITFDTKTGLYRFDAHTAAGHSVTSDAVFEDGVFEWRLPETPRGRVRYRLMLDEEGRWYEVGEGTSDGETWHRFFEMTLTKVR